MMEAVGAAFASFLRERMPSPWRIIVGRDTRLSGEMLEAAFAAGAASVGAEVSLIGVVPTPAVAWLTCAEGASAGAMISASHNPYHDNGIKLFDARAHKLSDQEEMEIEEKIAAALAGALPLAAPHEIGRIRHLQGAGERYLAHLLNAWDAQADLTGQRIVVDCAHGAAYAIAPKLLSTLGAEVIALHDQPNGRNINEACGSLYPHLLRDIVRDQRACIGIALDGDADRLIVVDEKGTILDGDHLMMIAAIRLQKQARLPADTLVTTVMSNLGLERALKPYAIRVERTPVGDRYVSEKMRELGATLGGEQSGHLIFSDYATTGDGCLAALQILAMMASSQQPLSALAAALQPYPQILKNLAVREKTAWETLPTLKLAVEQAEAELGEEGRILIRYSGTENKLRIMVEGAHLTQIERIAHELTQAFSLALG